MHAHKVTFTAADLREAESGTALVSRNPYRGFYYLLTFTLDDSMGDRELDNWVSYYFDKDDSTLVLLEVNLSNYRSTPLSDTALSQLNLLLSRASADNKKLIIRFLYDWNGKPEETEPEDISLVKTHISQTAAIVNQYTDTVFLLQGCFVGAYGEMHSSPLSETSCVKELIRLLDKEVDPAIFLAVRTPRLQRICTESPLSVTEKNAFDSTLDSRLSLFNDGIFGSQTDLGTYGSVTRSDEAFTEKGDRSQELQFQDLLCSYVPNGGEAVGTTELREYPACLKDLSSMHVSYLNAGYDPDLISYWKESGAYDYIAGHLGYRYVVTSASAKMRGPFSSKISVRVMLKNQGFGPSYRKFDPGITLVRQEDNFRIPGEVESGFDIRRLPGNGEETSILFTVSAGELSRGPYDVFFTLTDPATGQEIALANQETGPGQIDSDAQGDSDAEADSEAGSEGQTGAGAQSLYLGTLSYR